MIFLVINQPVWLFFWLKFNFILVCLPDSHQTLYEWINFLAKSGGIRQYVNLGLPGKESLTDTYRFVNKVPIRDGFDL